MSGAHTPGPWIIGTSAWNSVNPVTVQTATPGWRDESTAIADIHCGNFVDGQPLEGKDNEWAANARLIAAAPDLLERATAVLSAWTAPEEKNEEGLLAFQMAIDALSVAIAKATNTQPPQSTQGTP